MSKWVGKFQGKLDFLSNMYKCRIEFDGLTYPSTENFYQAMKCKYPHEREKFTTINPYESKKLGRVVEVRSDWEEIKIIIMKQAIDLKFEDKHLQDLLIHVHDNDLVEENNWGDTFWGICNGVGKNYLGQILKDKKHKILNERNTGVNK